MYNQWCGVFGGRIVVPPRSTRPPFWRYNYPARQLMFSGYHLNEKNIPFYIDKILKSRITWLHGYPSLIALLASCILEKGINLNNRINCITIGAESQTSKRSY